MVKLTNLEDWENTGYIHEHLSMLNPNLRSDRCFINKFSNFLKNCRDGQKIIEIGCCPGRFLSFFFQKYHLDIFGVDYDGKAIKVMLENFNKNKIKSKIYKSDFLTFKTKKKYNYVCSFGFIEHFKNNTLEQVLNKHIEIASPKGFIFIAVPNLTYVNKIFFNLIKPDVFLKHNTSVMNKDFFVHFAKRHNLKIIELDYFGGIHIPLNNSLYKFKILNVLFNNKLLDKLNSKYFSHYLGCIFQKN